MNSHHRILQQRIQSIAIGNGGDRSIHREHFERTHHERVQDEEESLRRHQDGDNVGHHVPKLAPVGENGDARITRQQPTPQQERAFLSSPPRRELVSQRHRPVAVLGHVGVAEIARHHGVDEDARRHCDQEPNGVDRTLGA